MKELDDLPEVLTVDEVAEYLRVDRRTVLATLVKTGRLVAARVGPQWRITRAALEAFLAHEHQVHIKGNGS